MFFVDTEKVVELLQAIKEKSITLDTIRHAPHPLCKSPPAQISGELHADEQTHTLLPIVVLIFTCVIYLDIGMHLE